MASYDISWRHGLIQGGAWVGFRLAWDKESGAPGRRQFLDREPYEVERPWYTGADPDPTVGGVEGRKVYKVWLVAVKGMTGLDGKPLPSGRTHLQVRADWWAFITLGADFEMQLPDGTTGVIVRDMSFREYLIEPYDSRHVGGGYLLYMELAHMSP